MRKVFASATLACATAVLLLASSVPTAAALIDSWLAADLAALDDGDAVGAWRSSAGRLAAAPSGDEPLLHRNSTPTGEPAVRFQRNRMTVPSSPVAGLQAFTLAVVFKVEEPGVDDGSGWTTKSGIVDASQSGAANDWGFVVRDTGFIAFGTGSAGGSDRTVYLDNQPDYPSVVDSRFHVAVCSWGEGSQTLYLDAYPPKTQSGVSTASRGNPGLSFGGINTGEMNRRFAGELAEVRFYDAMLTPAAVSDLIAQLSAKYITSPRPVIASFTASTNFVLSGSPVTLSWVVTNAASVSIDNGVGVFAGGAGSIQVVPLATTLYTLTATNGSGTRTAQTFVTVDPGIPAALDMSVSVLKNQPRAFTLAGNDPQGGALSFSLGTLPRHGVLSGTPPALVYTPQTGYTGPDAFTFTVHDGQNDSPPATVQLYIEPEMLAPHGIFLTTASVNSAARPGDFLLAMRAVDANRYDTHAFSLVPGEGGADNAMFTLSGNRLLAGAGFPVGEGSEFSIRVRATDAGGLFVERPFSLRAKAVLRGVVINEVHYNPDENTIRGEFIELYNAGAAAADLSGWRIAGGVNFVFPGQITLSPGACLVVASDPAVMLARHGVEALGPWTGNLSGDGEKITLRDAEGLAMDVVDYRSEFPWPIAANGDGASMELINPGQDNDLGSSWASSPGMPSPGARNGGFLANAAPNIRQVDHSPKQPASTNPLIITAKVTDPDGVASVALSYQVVPPGNYVPAFIPLTVAQLNANPSAKPPPNSAFESPANWVGARMHDDGLDGDEQAGDDVYTAVLPAQPNRSLVRYRITCTDSLGASRRAPFADDPSLNFACFVYNSLPDYGPVPASQLGKLPVYFLLTRAADFDATTAYNSSHQLPQFIGGIANPARFVFNWPGAFVYDGKVYDHIRYRLRGANGRYQPGKRSFRLRFNDGRFLEARDEFGRPYPRKWSTLNTGKGQSNRLTLTYALNEYLNFLLLNIVGVPSPLSHYFHWRVIRGPLETPDACNGDFYGISWAQENYDRDFLEAHGLPKGNLYKLINAQRDPDPYRDMVGQQRYQAPFAFTNGADGVRIQNILLNPSQSHTDAFLLANVNYTNWFSYQAVAEAVRNYDTWPGANKNAAWYFEPDYNVTNQFCGRFWTLPWDWTDSWGPTWNEGHDLAWNGIFGPTASLHRDLQKEYRNTVREIRDLLFQPDQINPLIDAVAARLAPLAPADLLRWSNCPPYGASYSSLGSSAGPGFTEGLPGYVRDMKDFMFQGGYRPWWIDRAVVSEGGWITRLDDLAKDSSIPNQPALSYAGPPGFPLDSLKFDVTPFSDPQGPGTFAATQWRVAEVLDTNNPPADPRITPPLEWYAAWDSGPLTGGATRMILPETHLKTNTLYRVRARHGDTSGRWSHWSAPFEFRSGVFDAGAIWRESLRLSEIMFHPPAWGGYGSDELEFLELQNIGATPLDLSGLAFTGGITFTFPSRTTIAPGAFLVLGRNEAALRAKYPGITVTGHYTGKLDNKGETIALSLPSGEVVLSVAYGTRAPWPVTPDGLGFSLVLENPSTGAYRASSMAGGSPMLADPPSAIPGVVINEVLSNPRGADMDHIEIFNPTTTAADLGGWFLTDDPSEPRKYRIPDGATLCAGCFMAIDEAQFGSGVSGGFGLSSMGEEVYLLSGRGDSELTGYSHGFSFGGAREGETFGRYVATSGDEQFPPQIAPSFGAENFGPRVGPVVISEIAPFGAANFVELRNITSAAVPLFDVANPTNTWRVNGLGFTFPPGIEIPSGGFVLLCASAAAEFRAAHNLSAGVLVFQYPGRLQASGEVLELLSPGAPSAQGAPYWRVDRVGYATASPWPALGGTNVSLQRIDSSSYGDDPVNWIAAPETPGFAAAAPLPAIRLAASVSPEAGVTISFVAQANRSYTVQYKDRLADAEWRLLNLVPVRPDERPVVIHGIGTTQSRFYRVETPGVF